MGGSAKIVQAILRATFQQLGERGFSALSVEDVARTAGINKTTVYRRWPTKADLVVAAILAARDEMPPFEETGDLRGDLVRLIRMKMARVATPRGKKIARALIGFDDDPELARVARAFREHRYSLPSSIIHRAVERGELRADTDPELLSELIHAAVFHRAIVLNDPIDVAYIERVVDQVLAGARSRGGKRIGNRVRVDAPRRIGARLRAAGLRSRL